MKEPYKIGIVIISLVTISIILPNLAIAQDDHNPLTALKSSNHTVDSFSSPLEQFKSEIPSSSNQCKKGFTLIIKNEDKSPVCVKPETASKLAQHGWEEMLLYQYKPQLYSQMVPITSLD